MDFNENRIGTWSFCQLTPTPTHTNTHTHTHTHVHAHTNTHTVCVCPCPELPVYIVNCFSHPACRFQFGNSASGSKRKVAKTGRGGEGEGGGWKCKKPFRVWSGWQLSVLLYSRSWQQGSCCELTDVFSRPLKNLPIMVLVWFPL